jgi:rubredoxin
MLVEMAELVEVVEVAGVVPGIASEDPGIEPGPEIDQEPVEGPEIEPEAEPRHWAGRSRADQGRGSAWARFLSGRDPHPVEQPDVILTGVRPFESAREFTGNPACIVCGGIRAELPDGWYCAGCEKMSPGDEAQIRMARQSTPSPSREKKVPDHPKARPEAPQGRRRKAKAKRVPYDPTNLKGGLG